MKKTFLCLLTVLITAVLLCSCTGDPSRVSESDNLIDDIKADSLNVNYNYQEENVSVPGSYTEYQTESLNFAFELFRNSYTANQNTAVAPANTYLQLSLLANASTKQTKSEITSALGSNLNTDNLNQGALYFSSRINNFTDKEDNKYFVNLKNILWCNDIFDIKREFLKTDKTYYDTEIYRFLFSDENALSKINNRIADFTDKNDTLKELNNNDCIYFTGITTIKDSWLEAYSENNIIKDTFNGTKETSETEFYGSSEFLLKDSTSTGFIKNFKNTPLKLCVIIPNDDISLSDYIKILDSDKLINFLNSLSPTERCNAYLPAFSKSENIDLTESLKKMGINSLFTDDANIFNMTQTDNIYLNQFVESIDFSISQNGISSDSKDSTEQKASENTELKNNDTIKANKPFIYAIIDNESNIPVYLGVVENL